MNSRYLAAGYREREILMERVKAIELEKEFQSLFGVSLGIADSFDAFMSRDVSLVEELYYHLLPFEIISPQMSALVFDLLLFRVSLPLTDAAAEKYGVSKDQTFGNTYGKYSAIRTAFPIKRDLLKTVLALEVNTFTARPFLRRVDYAQLWIAHLRSRAGTHEVAQDINHWASLQKDGELIFVESSDNDEKELIQRSASKRVMKLIESFQDCLKVLDRKKSEKEPVETIAHAQNILKNILSLIQV